MVKYNTEFTLGLSDLELIETALRAMLAASQDTAEQHDINRLLGDLHNQKTWYRPGNNYISG
jgi:hypothetical protein